VEATGDRGDSQLVSEADLASNRKMEIQNQCCAPGTPSVNSGCSALVRRKARAIPKEDYVYGSPIVDNYRVQHAYWFDNATPEYKRPWMIQVGRFPANVNVNFNPNLNAQALAPMDRAEEKAEPKDVGEQALMRGLDTAFPFFRLGLSLV
jgi:hypothetical protein